MFERFWLGSKDCRNFDPLKDGILHSIQDTEQQLYLFRIVFALSNRMIDVNGRHENVVTS